MSAEVVHIARQYLPSIGGLEDVVRNIAAQQMLKSDQHARVVTLNKIFKNHGKALPATEQIDGVEVLRLPFVGSYKYPICPGVLQHLESADIIHVHGVDFFYDFLALTKWFHKKPLVLSTHGGFFHTRFAEKIKKVYFNTITRNCAKVYEKVVATSDSDGEIFEKIVKRPKLEVIENGVNVNKFAACAAESLQPCCIYFGRWSANKGLFEMLDLFKTLTTHNPNWRFIIAGRAFDITEAQLRALAEQKGLKNCVQIVNSPSDDELRSLMSQASYFVCLSHHEGFGLAAIEAMSAGLIPLLSAIPPFEKVIRNSNSGIVLPRDIASASQKIVDLHTAQEQHYTNNRQQAINFANQYAWSGVAERYMEVYNAIRR